MDGSTYQKGGIAHRVVSPRVQRQRLGQSGMYDSSSPISSLHSSSAQSPTGFTPMPALPLDSKADYSLYTANDGRRKDTNDTTTTHLSSSASTSPPSRPPSPWIRKPLWTLKLDDASHSPIMAPKADGVGQLADAAENGNGYIGGSGSGSGSGGLHRHLSLLDLVSVGVGGTVGSGIFVLCGLIAHNYAGPATIISWAVAGLAACLSGCCFAELAGRIPTAGSSYAYSYVAMGELPAFLSAACLTLEYLFSGSAVARSWGDKVVEWLRTELPTTNDSLDGSKQSWILTLVDPGMGINPMAFVVSAISVKLLMDGVKESKAITNFFTASKVILVIFMTVCGFRFMNPKNLIPVVPPEYGISGIFRGATSSFFGYIGYDEVCCIAAEAINPKKNMPRAVMLTIATVTVLYVFAALSLVGMQPYSEISSTSGFVGAFRSNGAIWAAQITAAGELLTLPVVVLITLMAQPRLQYALAEDGLLPKFFSEVDSTGNLKKGTFAAGIVLTLTATFVPFTYINDLISAGILLAFCMTDSSVVLLRHESPEHRPFMLEKMVALFTGASFLSCFVRTHVTESAAASVFLNLSWIILIASCGYIRCCCPRSVTFGGTRAHVTASVTNIHATGEGYFTTPFVPFLPCLGMYVNCYLITELDLTGIGMLILYLAAAAVLYFAYGVRNSVGNNHGWLREQGNDDHNGIIMAKKNESDEFTPIIRNLSLPNVRSDSGILT